ncbi:putative f-box/lrr-repeat protein [Quercus suber]|uniref:F-box/lrr-repeat protein n=1 Tax=Quercus suber TaxID=58331 RepID=A0AAW0KTR0_QUESU
MKKSYFQFQAQQTQEFARHREAEAEKETTRVRGRLFERVTLHPLDYAAVAMSLLNLKNRCDKTNNFPDDQFSKLPDEILVSIVSLMPLKEASQTSILSHRWRYLRTFTNGSLDFDCSALLNLLGIEKYCEKRKGWVNGVLRLHQGSTIDELRACSVVSDKNFTLDIENWLSFLLRKKVKRFALECKGLRNCDYQQYTLTDQFLCNYGLDSLTVLCLTYVQVTEKALLYVLSNCPFLEVLSVECLDSLQNLKPSGPLVGLRNVAISTSYYAHVARILLGNVPNLVEASYAGLYAFFLLRERDQMPSYLSLLETLSLVLTWQRISQFSRFPILRNLRHLNLTLLVMDVKSLLGCTSLLVAFPILHRFVVDLMG